MVDLTKCYNIADLRRAAKSRLPKGLFEFIDRATEDEIAVRNNRAAIERIRIMPRAPLDVSNRSLSTTVFGKEMALPMAIAPTGGAGLMWYKAEKALAAAAKAAGIPFTMATGSITSIEEVARDVGGRLWLQLYVWPDRELTYGVVKRAAAAGFEALLVTVDTPVSPNREYNVRNGFGLPFVYTPENVLDMALHPRWLIQTMLPYFRTTGMPPHANYPDDFNDARTRGRYKDRIHLSDTVDRAEIRRLRDLWPGKLVVKGVMHPDDAREMVELGADGILVSNHGGRNFDSAVATFDALPGVVAAVGDRSTVLVDSGIRRGVDIMKAVALGAQAVLTGRATLFGAAAGGQAGAARAIELFRHELSTAMANAGVRTIEEITADLLRT